MAGAAREHWNSRTGFILAAVGSAVGLGNMWRFSYLTAEKGGAAFVALYLLFTIIVGLPLLLAELTIGRGAQRSPIQALAHFAEGSRGASGWKWLGLVFVFVGGLILAYYGVIAGWTVRYAGEAALQGFSADPAAHFGAIASGPEALAYHVLFMLSILAIVSSGIKKGVERVSIVAMPLLFVLVVGIALYASTLDGASGGYTYYLNADIEKVWAMDVIVSAAGQSFFSLSLGMGAMLTYASYLGRDNDLPAESAIIAAADFGVAFVAGLMVFPVIFAFGLVGEVGESTVGALFVALPQAFASMGGVGRVVGFLFFVALIVGALTSAISLLEVVVSAAMDSLGWERIHATLVLGAVVTVLGAPAAFSTDVLGVMDEVANNIFLVGGGLGLAVFVGFVMKQPVEEAADGSRVPWLNLWLTLVRWVVPVVLLWVLWHSVPATIDAVVGLFTG